MKFTSLKSFVIAAGILSIGAQAANNTSSANSRYAQTSLPKSSMNYTYAGIKYESQQLDKYNCDQDGLSLYGSFDLNGQWFAQGSYTDVSGDKDCGSETLSIGAGYRAAFKNSMDIYGSISFEDTSVDLGESDSGIVLAGGLRGYLAHQLEGKIEVAHHTAFDGTTLINGGLVYWFNTQFAITGDLSFGSDTNVLAIGARMTF